MVDNERQGLGMSLYFCFILLHRLEIMFLTFLFVLVSEEKTSKNVCNFLTNIDFWKNKICNKKHDALCFISLQSLEGFSLIFHIFMFLANAK